LIRRTRPHQSRSGNLLLHNLHGNQEAVATSRNRLHILWRIRLITERHPHLAHSCVQTVVEVAKGFTLPKVLLQLRAGYDLALPLGYSRQQPERLFLQWHPHPILAQLSLGEIHLVRPELQEGGE